MNLREFWFGDISLTPEYYESQVVKWFYGQDPLFDRECEKFLQETTTDPLTQILIWDQLPRNVFRGKAQAYTKDVLAQELCLKTIDTEYERTLTLPEKMFLYMPLEHAEDIHLQELSVEKFYALHIDSPQSIKPWTHLALKKAIEHMKTIREFGCFPKRIQVKHSDSDSRCLGA